MSLLVVTLGALVLGVWLFRYVLRRSIERTARILRDREDAIMQHGIDGMDAPDQPVNFGYKCAWYAVRSKDGQAVARSLGITRFRPCNWRIGIDKAYEGWTYITPSVNGWTLVCSHELLDHDEEGVRQKLEALSQAFGEAQFFATYRVIDLHAWAWAEQGRLTRYYAYLGERGENLDVVGEPTPIEQELDLVNTLGPEAQQEGYFDREGLTYPSEQVVMQIAAAWSIDPTSLERRTDVVPGPGWLCSRM